MNSKSDSKLDIKYWLSWAEQYLTENQIDFNFNEIEYLLAAALKIKRTELLFYNLNEITKHNLELFKKYIEKRSKGLAVEYVLERTEFMGLEFKLNLATLIPRTETEQLVEKVLENINTNKNLKILDMCTGSGNIAVSLAYFSKAHITAIDISPSAIAIAKSNAALNGVLKNINFLVSDLFKALPEDEKFDIIVSNPPYINDKDYKKLPKEVLNEPEIALRGGEEGMDFIKNIILSSKKYLNPGAKLFMEISYDQKDMINKYLVEKGFKNYEFLKDYSKINRILILAYE